MPTNEKRGVRFTMMLTAEEWAEAKRRAGMVPVAVWARVILFPPSKVGLSDRNEPEAESQKISKPGVEVDPATFAAPEQQAVVEAVKRSRLPRAVPARRAYIPVDRGEEPVVEKKGRCTYMPIGDKKCPACGKVHSHV